MWNNQMGFYSRDKKLHKGVDRYVYFFSLLLCLGMVIFGNAALAAAIPENAMPLTLDASAEANISSGGAYAYFSFTPTKDARYIFASTGDADTYGYLYNGSMEQLTADDDGGDNRNFKITYELNAGVQYYFGVRYYSSDNIGTFTVSLVIDPTVVIDGYVRNESTGNSLDNVSVTYGSMVTSTSSDGYYRLEFAIDDVDGNDSLVFSKIGFNAAQVASFTVEAGSVYHKDISLNTVTTSDIALWSDREVEISNGGEFVYFGFVPTASKTYHFYSTSSADTYAYLFDADMNEISRDDDGGENRNFDLAYELIEGEQYYFAAGYYSSSTTGTYTVTLTYDKKGFVSGYVKDATTNDALNDVRVTYGDMETYTDGDGYYEFNSLIGTKTLSFSKYAYNDVEYNNITCNEDQTTTKNVSMTRFIPTDATLLSLDNLAKVEFNGSDDDAYYTFTPVETKTYHFYLISENDVQLYLYNASMEEIVEGSYLDDWQHRVSATLTADEKYYFKVRSDYSGIAHAMISTTEKGAIVGHVTNASGNTGLNGAVVTYGTNVTNSDDNGYYLFVLPTQTANLSFYKNGYIEAASENVSVQLNKTVVENAVLSETLEEDQYRVVLTWGSSPSDLDSHLEGPGYHVYYSSKTGKDAELDVDDTSSYGPETITFKTEDDKTYIYYVHDYSNKGNVSSTALANSDAVVRIFNGNKMLNELRVPGEAGVYWNVFSIRNGQISYGNTVGASSPGSTTKAALVESNQYLINVVDENGVPLRGAKVTYDSQEDYSDEYGNTYFDAFSTGNPVITVELAGYLTWTNQNSSWSKSATRHETVIMYPESVGSLKLNTARYSNNSNMSNSTELLTTTKKLSLGSNNASFVGDFDFGNFYIKCAAKDTSNVQEYQLWQGSKKILVSSDGFFSLNTDSFSKGGNCFIRTVSKMGETVDTRINLIFALAEVNQESAVNLTGKSVSFMVSDSVPFIGGSNFDISLPIRIPITAYASEDKLRIGFNVNLAGGKDKDEQIKEVKKLTSELKRMYGQKVGKLTGGQAMKYKSLIKGTNQWKFFKGGEINVLGYAEADWGSSTATGAIILQGKINPIGYDFNTWCVVVPVTVQVEFSVEGTATFEVSYNFDTSTLDGALGFAPSATLKAFGGVGISKLVGVGAYGGATLDADFDILPTPLVNSVDLTGELGLKAYVGFFTYEKPFAYNTWHLYTGMSTRGEGEEAFDLSSEEFDIYQQLTSGMYDASNYTKANLDYLGEEKDHLGKTGEEALTARTGGEDMKTTLKTLIENTYRNAQPVMVSAGDAIYAAFLRADANSGRVYTVVSKYDGENWSSATAASSGGSFDNKPSLIVDNSGRIWLAYARAASGYTADSMLSYAQNQEIVVGQIDAETLAFTQARVYSDMGYAHMQQFSVIGGKPTLAWVGSQVSTDNDVLWPENNSIYKAVCDGINWGEALPVNEVNNVITELAIGEENGDIAFACVSDQDNDSSTGEDRQLIVFSNGESRVLSEGASGISYANIPGSSSASTFLWLEDGVLHSANGDSLDIERLTGEYRISGDSIYFSVPTENGAELCVVKYENGEWSIPITLTTGEGYLENISIANLNGGDYVLGLYTDVTITDTGIDDSKDLVWSNVSAVSDLVIEDVVFDSEALVVGEDIPVTVEFKNAGDHKVASIDVYLDGNLLSTELVEVALGQTQSLTVNMSCPSDLVTYAISVVETGRTDYHPEDNEFSFKIGYPDLSIELQSNQIGEKTTVYGIIRNEGIQSASGRLFFTDLQGRVLYENTFSEIAADDVLMVSFDFDWSGVEAAWYDVKAILECDGEDLFDFNNVDTMHLTFNGHRKIEHPDIVLPSMLKTIEEEAFAGAKFKSVKVPDGTLRIEANAFKDCTKLEQIEIPGTVSYIAEEAFEGTNGFVIYCPSGSVAESYAQEHEITCIIE